MNSTIIKSPILFTLCMSISLLTACGGKDGAASGQKFENEDDSIRVGTEDLGLPEGWIQDVPFPSDAKVLMSMDMAGTGHKVSYSTKESVSDLVEWYQKMMKEEGWTGSEVTQAGSSTLLNYNKNGRKVNVIVTRPSERVTSVSVTTRNAP